MSSTLFEAARAKLDAATGRPCRLPRSRVSLAPVLGGLQYPGNEAASGSQGYALDLERHALCQRRWWPQQDTHVGKPW